MLIHADPRKATIGRWLGVIDPLLISDMELGILEDKTLTFGGHSIKIQKAYVKDYKGYVVFDVINNSFDLYGFFDNTLSFFQYIRDHVTFYKYVSNTPIYIGAGIVGSGLLIWGIS